LHPDNVLDDPDRPFQFLEPDPHTSAASALSLHRCSATRVVDHSSRDHHNLRLCSPDAISRTPGLAFTILKRAHELGDVVYSGLKTRKNDDDPIWAGIRRSHSRTHGSNNVRPCSETPASVNSRHASLVQMALAFRLASRNAHVGIRVTDGVGRWSWAGADSLAGAENEENPKSDRHGGDKDGALTGIRHGAVQERSGVSEEAAIRARMELFFVGVETIDSSH